MKRPETYAEFKEIAIDLFEGRALPKGVTTAGQALAIIMTGDEVGFAPMQALKAFFWDERESKPAMHAEGMLAIVRAKPGFKIKEWREGSLEGEDLTAIFEITRPDGEVIVARYGIEDAKRALLWGKGGAWVTNPERMLIARARMFGLKDGASDVIAGVTIAEELEDAPIARAAPPAKSSSLDSIQAHLDGDHIPDDFSDITIKRTITITSMPKTPEEAGLWVQAFLNRVALADKKTLAGLHDDAVNVGQFGKVDELRPELIAVIDEAIAKREAELNKIAQAKSAKGAQPVKADAPGAVEKTGAGQPAAPARAKRQRKVKKSG